LLIIKDDIALLSSLLRLQKSVSDRIERIYIAYKINLSKTSSMVCRAERNGRASEASLREEDELSSSPASGEDLAPGLQPKRFNRWDSEDAIRYLYIQIVSMF
jgi:hypothetical protein